VSPTKKIAILSDFPLHVLPHSPFPAPKGHYATWLPQLARAFEREREFEFHWLALNPGAGSDRTIQAWNQKFHVLPSSNRGRAATLFWADRHRIQNKLREIHPHLVHGWGNENIWGWAAAFSGFPNIFSLQGLLSEYAKLGKIGLRERLMAWIETGVLKKAEMITTESSWARTLIEKKTGRNDIRLVEYGVPHAFFGAEPHPDKNHPYAIMVGTADFRKGIDFALQLFSRPKLGSFQLKIIGGITAFGEKWKKVAPGNVEWLGRKSQAEIIAWMASARCLILPTRADVCANVVKEARVLGVPVVASPHGGHVQYVQHGHNGFLCPLDSHETWEQSLLRFFQDPRECSAMGSFLRQEHRDLLRPERTAEAFLALYQERLVPPSGKEVRH